jgi:hypothetical protein
MRSAIQTKWGKFTSQEIVALKSNDDLVALACPTKRYRALG